MGHDRSNDASQVRFVITATTDTFGVCVDVTLYSCQIQTFILEGRGKKEKKIHMKAQNPLLWESVYTYRGLKTAFLKKIIYFLTFDKNLSEKSSKIKSFSKSRKQKVHCVFYV